MFTPHINGQALLVDTEGAILTRGTIPQIQSFIRNRLAHDQARNSGRYAALRANKRIENIACGDVVEVRAGRTGALWESFSVFSVSEWTRMVSAGSGIVIEH